MSKRRALPIVVVLLVGVLAACHPPGPVAPPPRFGLDVCNQALPGSRVLTDIDATGVAIVCEATPSDTGGVDAFGWYDKNVIYIFTPPANQPVGFVRKVAEHEYGHAEAARHPDWAAGWNGEQFAESWAWCNYPHEVGVGYSFIGSVPTADQCGQLRAFYAYR